MSIGNVTNSNTAYHQSYSNLNSLNQEQTKNKFINSELRNSSYQYDDMFEQAEKNKKIIPRNDPIISMQHANVDEDTYTGNQGKNKSRIGGAIGTKQQETAKDGLMNSQASQDYTTYMNAKYPLPTYTSKEYGAKDTPKNDEANERLKHSATESQMTS